MQNNNIEISPHANRRACQRAIPPALLPLVLEFGKTEHSHGDIIYHFHNKGAWQKAVRRLSECGQVVDNRWRNIYIVVTRDFRVVITIGWRYKRVKKQWQPRRNNKKRR